MSEIFRKMFSSRNKWLGLIESEIKGPVMLPLMTRTVQTRLQFQPLVFGKTVRENEPALDRTQETAEIEPRSRPVISKRNPG